MFLYRISKMIGEGINLSFRQVIINVLHIIKRNQRYIYGQIDQILNLCDIELRKEYEYMKSRFDELKCIKVDTYDLSLKMHD